MKTKPLTIRQFFRMFPTDDACLEHVMRTRYGQRYACLKCGKSSHHFPRALHVSRAAARDAAT